MQLPDTAQWIDASKIRRSMGTFAREMCLVLISPFVKLLWSASPFFDITLRIS